MMRLGVVFAAAVGASGAVLAPPPALDLRVDHNSPSTYFPALASSRVVLAVDNPTPLLSWAYAVPSEALRGADVEAFRVTVMRANSPNSEPLWDSGVTIPAGASNQLRYTGPASPGMRACYSVSWRAETGGPWSLPSDPACFEFGLLSSDWDNSTWLAPPAGSGANLFRSEFSADSYAAVRVYASALGWGKVYLNGQELSSGEKLGVGWTRWAKRSFYFAYDATSALKSGANAIGVSLGAGWRDTTKFPWRDNDVGKVYTPRALRVVVRAQLKAGGDWVTLCGTSTSTWKTAAGPVTFDSVYDGETYDASKEIPGWNAPGFSGSWAPAADASAQAWTQTTNITVQPFPPVRVIRVKDPVSVTKVADAEYLIDFGDNLAGVCSIILPKAQKGQNITLRHAEAKMHQPYGDYGKDGWVYMGNLRSAKATDTYIFSGNEQTGAAWEPAFTYHGFRFVVVSGWPSSTPPSVKMLHFRSDIKKMSSFRTSDPLLDRIHGMAAGAQGSNLMTVPTDCDQRDERLGWMGDAGLSAETMAVNYDMTALHKSYVNGMVNEMDADGAVPDTVPFARYGNRPADPSWGYAFPGILYAAYKQGGTLDTYNKYKAELKRYFDNQASQVVKGGGLSKMSKWGPYGDWVPADPKQKPSNTVPSAATWIMGLEQSVELADAAGDSDLKKAWESNLTWARSEFKSAFWNSEAATFENGGQTASALGLAAGVLTDAEAKQAADKLSARISSSDNGKLTVGIIGNKFLFSELRKYGYSKTASDLLHGYAEPSFGYMLNNTMEPAVSNLWELWNAPTQGPGMNSRNHHMFSSVDKELYAAAGVDISDLSGRATSPIVLRAGGSLGGLDAADVSVRAAAGSVSFSWGATSGTVSYSRISLPVGVNAALHVPIPSVGTQKQKFTLCESNRPVIICAAGACKAVLGKDMASPVAVSFESEGTTLTAVLGVSAGQYDFGQC